MTGLHDGASHATRCPMQTSLESRPDVSTTGSERAPRILFLALVDNIGMERVSGALRAHGAHCALLSPPGFHATKPRAMMRLFGLPRHRGLWLGAVFARPQLERAIRSWQAELIVPLD